MLLDYLVALAVTLMVEAPLYVTALVGLWRVPVRRALAAALVVNVATHPVAWWSLVPFAGQPWYLWLVLAVELAVCAVEWALLAALCRRALRRWAPPRRAFPARVDVALLGLVVVGVNAASVLAGWL
jgi:hypothetical protein